MVTLVIGGSGSGKSEFAENELVRSSAYQRVYVATMMPFDEECMARIKKHRAMRAKKGFLTVECYTHLEELQLADCLEKKTDKYGFDSCQNAGVYDILLECISNLCANEMFAADGRKGHAADAVVAGVKCLAAQASQLVVVTNDVFADGVSYDASVRQYMECLGEVNVRLARMADRVVEVVAGYPLFFRKERVW